MSIWKEVSNRVRYFGRRSLFDRELEQEVQFHLAERVSDLEREGLTHQEALNRANREFGSMALIKEDSRAAWRLGWMEDFFADLRFAFRMSLRNPGFTVIVVVTLALGIGANTAIFSIVNGVLLRPLPFPDPDRLVRISFNDPADGSRELNYSVPELDDLRNRSGIFADVSVAWPVSVNLTGTKEPDRLELLAISPNYFSMLGASPQLGRLIGPEDTAQGFAEAVVISDKVWNRAFGRDPNILGRSLRLDNDLYTVVGVLPPGFRHPGKTVSGDVDVWGTAGFSANPFPAPARNVRLLPEAIGRLRPEVSPAQAQTRLDNLAAELKADYPNDYTNIPAWSIRAASLQQFLVGNVRPMLLVLMAAVVTIILIASVNVANLLLARASARQREIAVRRALGASSARMVRQMLTESLALSLTACAAGVLAAGFTLTAILRLVPAKIPRLNEVSIDSGVLLFAISISLVTGLLFGCAPAIQSARAGVSAAMREGSLGAGSGRQASRLRSVLILSEFALAIVLMIGAGLLLRTFMGLLKQSPGFNPSGVVTASFWVAVPNDPTADPYAKPEAMQAFVRNALARLRNLPGVQSAGITTAIPTSDPFFRALISLENDQDRARDRSSEFISISPDYLNVLEATLISGRLLEETDAVGKPEVAIIDETTARRYWPGQEPVGKRFRVGRAPAAPWRTVVGIIADIRHDGLDKDAVPHIYVPIYQIPGRALAVAVRTSLPPSSLDGPIRREIQAVDPGLPVFAVRSMDDLIGESLAPRRFSAELVGVFAALALLSAAIGIYGLLTYMVSQRTQEIGIRMALGAQSSDIRDLILGKGVLLTAAGLAIGLLLGAIVAPATAALLYGVRPMDPAVFISVPAVLGAVALFASYMAARRAARVEPNTALR